MPKWIVKLLPKKKACKYGNCDGHTTFNLPDQAAHRKPSNKSVVDLRGQGRCG